ncbi:MAG: hypothetical protein CMI30_01740 [Opitutae bacterium]|nr:hypothetical protein [Opitutae bacterium]
MNDRLYSFDELNPEEALGMLAALPVPAKGKSLIKDIRIGLQRTAFGCHASLFFPDPHMEKNRASKVNAKAQFLKAMVDCYHEIKGREPAHVPSERQGSELEKGLMGLILNCMQSPEDPTPIVEEEVMVVSRDVTAGVAADQFHHIQLHASFAYIAEADSALTGEHYYLFRVKKDKARKSTFNSMLGTGILEFAELLNCFDVGERHIYLPQKHTVQVGDSTKDTPILPGAAAVNDFCSILLLLQDGGTLSPPASGTSLAAVCPIDSVEEHDSEGGAIYHLLYLGQVRWLSQYDPHLRPVGVEEYQVHQLVDSGKAQKALRPAIADVNANAGYRLELRQVEYEQDNEQEREKVKEQLAELEHRLEYLNGARVPAPQLFRFTASQLPALAFTLRRFHVKSLEQGAITYGFQSNRDYPQGVHYLFVDVSRSVELEANPIPLLEGVTGSPIRYQVDPLWARHYLPHSSDSLVYVPEGCTLYPPLHDWETEGSDDYLRAVMKGWFHGRNGGLEIPKKPIYVFDGVAGPGRRINVTVLNKDSFVPIKHKLGWINDNLQVYESFPIQDVIKGLASFASRRQLSETLETKSKEMFSTLQAESEQVLAQSNEMIQRASEEIIANVESLVEGYHEEIPDFIDFVKKTTRELNTQKKRVNAFYNQREDIEKFLFETEQGIDAVSALTEQVKTEIAFLRSHVGLSMKNSDQALREMKQQVGERITLLETHKKALLKRLKTAHRIFSRKS